MSHVRKNPTYRLHKARNCAVVTINGKNHYLGEYQSAASYEKYARLIAEHESAAPIPASATMHMQVAVTQPKATVNELLLAYTVFARWYYTKDGSPTREVTNMIGAMRPLRELYGRTAAIEFGPKALKAVRQLQRLTGMRPCELVLMRSCDIDMTGQNWIYEPHDHKNRWRGHRRLIPLGPKAQKIVKQFLKL